VLDGHIDEIGLMVTYIDEEGYLYIDAIGGWDAQVLVGQRVHLSGRDGPVIGVIGKKPIHLMQGEERSQASKIEQMWVDIGAKSRSEALEYVRVGDVAVIDAPLYNLPNQRLVSRSIDNRIGAFIVLEALRRLAAQRPTATVAAVAATQEEIRGGGAQTAAVGFAAQIALVVDVTFTTDHPGTNRQRDGDVRLGGGPVLSRGSANSPLVFEHLRTLAEQADIPYQVQVTPRHTGTDADTIHAAGAGVATGVVSVPNRYMHSPNEMIDLTDVEHIIQLVVAFVRSVESVQQFIPV
jgi:endoglucanase